MNAGTRTPQLSNCFVVDMEDDIDHIAATLTNVMQITRGTGGIGLAATKLRAEGSPIRSNNTTSMALAFGVYPYVTAPEAHCYLAKQMWEEANHCSAFEYVLNTFDIDREASFGSHVTVASMAAKEQFELRFIRRMTETTLDISTVEDKRDFVRNLVAFNVVLEGIRFYSGFMVALSFRQRNLLRNIGFLVDWVVRDESLHLKFGMNLILTVLEENPEIATDEFTEEIRGMIVDAVALEEAYNRDLLPSGVLGLNADYVNTYVCYVADPRLEELGFTPCFGATNPARWMAAANDTRTQVNFFESTNTSYEVNATSFEAGPASVDMSADRFPMNAAATEAA